MVWNRSPDKAQAMAAVGADVALTASEAIAASPVTLICLWDFAAADQVLAAPDVQRTLAGRVLVQLTTGSADEATRQAEWLHDRGASFLAGGIMCYPRAVGAPDTIVLYSGDPEVFAEHETCSRSLRLRSATSGTARAMSQRFTPQCGAFTSPQWADCSTAWP